MMANVPPQRFNYQQRVGRAGRSGQAVLLRRSRSCRDRSHDDYYFRTPEGSPATSAAASSTSTRADHPARGRRRAAAPAFRALAEPADADAATRIHGIFGRTEEWPTRASGVVATSSTSAPTSTRSCDRLGAFTGLRATSRRASRLGSDQRARRRRSISAIASPLLPPGRAERAARQRRGAADVRVPDPRHGSSTGADGSSTRET